MIQQDSIFHFSASILHGILLEISASATLLLAQNDFQESTKQNSAFDLVDQ